MKTAGFKRNFTSGVNRFDYSRNMVQDGVNKIKEEEQSIVIEELPSTGQVDIEKPETNYIQP